MIGHIAILTILLAFEDGPEVNAAQFARIVKEHSASLKSVSFVYEGKLRWIGPPDLGATSKIFDSDFQGTYLYRADGAAVVDIYDKKVNPDAIVMRRTRSVLNGHTEELGNIRDSKTPIDPRNDIQRGQGSVSSLNGFDTPQELFWNWYWSEWADHLARRNYTFQGWEQVEGRKCLRFQLDSRVEQKGDGDYQRFWVDVERDAHVVRGEFYRDRKLTVRIDNSLSELTDADGKRTWFPVRSHTRYHIWGDTTHAEPVSERIIRIVDGAVRINVDLPDNLFTSQRPLTLPSTGALGRLEEISGSNPLRREFDLIPPRKPF